ncbi:MAG TPA: hypothetical protein VGS17_09535 [Candidatus Limnocylindria bacterium]|nr:hypothetical protein [Candidatus Limnocylindria bacterium]
MVDYRAFVRGLPRAVADQLGDAAPLHHGAPMGYMTKLWFGNKDLHYECGVYLHRKVIELGLHFEGGAMTNLQLLGAFRARSKLIARRLPTARIEAWDKGWARVWEPLDLGSLDERDGAKVAKLLAKYIRVLEPILEAELPADVRWSR